MPAGPTQEKLTPSGGFVPFPEAAGTALRSPCARRCPIPNACLVFQRSEARSQQSPSFAVVVAIDFGTTSSGYAFSFCSDPEAIHMMR